MKKKLFAALAWVLLAGVAIVFPLSQANAVSVYRYETGARYWDEAKAAPGYNLFSSGAGSGSPTRSNTGYLVDYKGRVVKSWTGVADALRLQEDGGISGHCQYKTIDNTERYYISAQVSPSVLGRDSYTITNAHHDGMRIWNRKISQYTYLLGINYTVSTADQYRAGFISPTGTWGSADGVAEYNEAGVMIWDWRFLDHCYQTRYPDGPNYIAPVAQGEPGYDAYLAKTYKGFDVYYIADADRPSGTNSFSSDWQHINGVDYDDEMDTITIQCKEFSQDVFVNHGATFVITDPNATDWTANFEAAARSQFSEDKIVNPSLPDGDLIYRWGHPSVYGAGTPAGFSDEGTTQMFGPHCITINQTYEWRPWRLSTNATQQSYLGTTQPTWWPNPGEDQRMGHEGGFCVYDNGCYKATGTRSIIHEVDTFLDENGNDTCPDRTNRINCQYYPEYKAGWHPLQDGYRMSKQEVHRFQSLKSTSHYSSHISGTQKIDRTHYLATAGNRGHTFQFTSEGEAVWDFVRQTSKVLTNSAGSSMFRSYWYKPNHPGIRALIEGGYMTDPAEATDLAGRTTTDLEYKLIGSGGTGCLGANASCLPVTGETSVCDDTSSCTPCSDQGLCTSPCDVPPVCTDCPPCSCASSDCCADPPACSCEPCSCGTDCCAPADRPLCSDCTDTCAPGTCATCCDELTPCAPEPCGDCGNLCSTLGECACPTCPCTSTCDEPPLCTACPDGQTTSACPCTSDCDQEPLCTACPDGQTTSACPCTSTCDNGALPCDCPPTSDCCNNCCEDLALCGCPTCECTTSGVCDKTCLDCSAVCGQVFPNDCPQNTRGFYNRISNPNGWSGGCCPEDSPCYQMTPVEQCAVILGEDIAEACKDWTLDRYTYIPDEPGKCPECLPCTNNMSNAVQNEDGTWTPVKYKEGWGTNN